MMRAKLDKELEKSNTRGRGDVLRKVGWGLKFIGPEKKSLNTKPSPLAASKSKLRPSSEARPRKRALLIGVSYKKQKHELKGTINDVKKMKNWLIHNFDFKQENILILTDEPEPELIPTKKNIQNCMKWFMESCQAHDSLVFYFSGHGLRQPDFDGDELDGFDETICPVDFMEAGMIFDNEIFLTIVQPLPKDAKLHAIVDACHSGSILDLSFVYNRERKIWEYNVPPSVPIKQTNGGLAITISACRDDQVAADTDAFSADSTMSGALTYTLTSIMKDRQEITYGDLLDTIYRSIEAADQQGCLAYRVLKRMLNARLLQKPQLLSSEPFDVYQTYFVL
ncbi:metacaspase-1 isoform X2 [Ricinus communis]|uniref:metacaspase-1 isoform X2 n=1 Tax=Ricinus communis TaxID=3988 RepID=UPI00201A8C94|nr:metacaspase-1 isoform X2 [Ricinus communis]